MVPLALQKQGMINEKVPYYFHYLASLGPLLSAFILTFITQGYGGLKNLGKRMIKWKIGPVWWLVILSPIILYFIVSAGIWMVKGEWPGPRALGQVSFLPQIGLLAPFLWTLTYGLGEETGWRGFALPRLQKNRNALIATGILTLFWAGWHIPAFFYIYDPRIIAGFLAGLFSGSIVFTWIYNSTSGSILAAILWHGLFNYTTGCVECKSGIISMVLSTLVIAWAILIVMIYKPANLSRSQRSADY